MRIINVPLVCLLLFLIFGIWERIQNIGFPSRSTGVYLVNCSTEVLLGYPTYGHGVPCFSTQGSQGGEVSLVQEGGWLGESFPLGLE